MFEWIKRLTVILLLGVVGSAYGYNYAIEMTKTASVKKAKIGDIVVWTITIKEIHNRGSALFLSDSLPSSLTYIQGSSRINGVAVEPTITNNKLDYGVIPLTPLQIKTVTIATRIEPSAKGEVKNIAVADDVGIDILTAEAVVEIVDDETIENTNDVLLECTDVIGKVFEDKDRNRYQDEGEEGVSHVELYTINGIKITTDKLGKYHVPCAVTANGDRGSNLSIKLDENSLPKGYEMTTDNPLVVRSTQGKMIRMDFGIAKKKTHKIDLTHMNFRLCTKELTQESVDQIKALSSIRLVKILFRTSEKDLPIARERFAEWKKVLEANVSPLPELETAWEIDDSSVPACPAVKEVATQEIVPVALSPVEPSTPAVVTASAPLELEKLAQMPCVPASDESIAEKEVTVTQPFTVNGASFNLELVLPPELKGVDFYHATDKSDIKKDEERNRKVREALSKFKHITIYVDGYTDRMESDAYNLKLSARRTAAVKKYFVDKRFTEGTQVSWVITNHGEHDLPVPTADNVAEQKNRLVRVRFEINGKTAPNPVAVKAENDNKTNRVPCRNVPAVEQPHSEKEVTVTKPFKINGDSFNLEVVLPRELEGVDFYHVTDKSDIKKDEERNRKVREALSKFKHITIYVDGYTDRVQSDQHNLKLSARRTAAVKKYFVDKRFTEGTQVSWVLTNHGEHNLPVPTADNVPEQKNRLVRVRFKID